MTERAMMTVREAARYLERSPQAVRRAVRAGRLRAVRVGRQWRIRRADLDAMFEAAVDAELVAEAERRLAAGGRRSPLADVKAHLGL